MKINYFLRQVQKPARYISIEEQSYQINSNGEAIALFYNGTYEESISSLAFQSLFAIFADQTNFRPYRYFMPEDDFLDLLQSESQPTLWSVDEQKKLNEIERFIVFNDGHSVAKLAALLHLLSVKKVALNVQSTLIHHPLLAKIAEKTLFGEDPFKLKTLVKNAENFASFLSNFAAAEAAVSLDSLGGFGSLSKPVKPIIPIRQLKADFRYVLQASEKKSAELFNRKANASDPMTLSYRKKLDKSIANIPNENELSLFPLGISNKLRQLEELQKTYLELFPTVKKVLAAGWRTIHLFFWMGHPLEEKDDWREFKKEVQAIADFIKSYKRISVQLHFIGYTPSPNSCFLWDDYMNTVAFKENKATIETLLERKNNFRATFESIDEYLDRLMACRFSSEDAEKFGKSISAFVEKNVFSRLDEFYEIEEKNFPSLCLGQAFDRNDFNFLADVDYLKLNEDRKNVSKIIAERIADESAELDLKLIKKARINANIHLSKTNDMVSTSLGSEEISYGRTTKLRASQQEDISKKYRLKFKRTGLMAFYSNVDARSILLNALDAAKIPVRMTKGFTPTAKIAFSAPTNTGVDLECEFVDIEINSIKKIDFKESLNRQLPEGMQIISYKEVHPKIASLASAITVMEFDLKFEEDYLNDAIVESLKNDTHQIIREAKNSRIELDVASFIHKVERDGDKLTVQLLTHDNRLLKIEELVQILNELKPVRFGDISIVKTRQFIYSRDQYIDPMDA